jgi:RNA polymerase sigma-70 factor (ECF subfamily)
MTETPASAQEQRGMPASAQLQTARPSPDASEDAFRAIYESELSYVMHTLRRMGVGERDLEDVTHDLFITVYRRLDDYDRSRPLRPWLCGIAFRTACDYRRLARHRRETHDEGVEARDGARSADDQVAAGEARALVMKALDELDLDKRAVLVMHDIDGHPMPDVALALSIPLNTAYSRLRAARAEFVLAVHRVSAQMGEP